MKKLYLYTVKNGEIKQQEVKFERYTQGYEIEYITDSGNRVRKFVWKDKFNKVYSTLSCVSDINDLGWYKNQLNTKIESLKKEYQKVIDNEMAKIEKLNEIQKLI